MNVFQTLAVMLLTYVQKPSLSDCEVVSAVLHSKQEFLKDDDSEV